MINRIFIVASVEVSLVVLSVETVSLVDVVLLVSVVTSAVVSLISDVTSFSFCWLLTWSMLSAVASMASCISLLALELG